MRSIILALFVVLFVGCSTAKKDETGSLTSSDSESTTLNPNAMDSDSGKAGDLKTVNFGYDSYELTDSARSVLKGNIEYLKNNPAVKIQIEGHCDERGSTQYNLALGENRANAVKKFVTNAGIAAARVSTTSFGKDRPLDPASNETAWAKNRRANFVIVSK